MNESGSTNAGPAQGSPLTVLLTLKDRAPYTIRWLSYANQIRFPFKVLIADGGGDEGIPRRLADRTSFPHLDYEYVRYPFDATYGHYYSKIADALSRIRTPFAVMADNDDFFVVDGLQKAIAFLKTHADFSACSGHIGTFWVWDSTQSGHQGVYGDRIEYRSSHAPISLPQDSAVERVRAHSRRYDTNTYYAVQRTTDMRTRFEALRHADLRDLFLAEFLVFFLISIAGKVKGHDALYLARQVNSADRSAETHQKADGSYVDRMLVPTWSRDFEQFIEVVSQALQDKERISPDEARRLARDCYKTAIAPDLLNCILREPSVPSMSPMMTRIVHRWVDLDGRHPVRRGIRKLYHNVSWLSMSGGREAFFNKRAHGFRRGFRPILKALSAKPEKPS